ncbi:MAG: hypothetical protein ABGY71_01175 [bacterium]|nr:hypothetical protein [Planctomycetota bacterium]HIL52543.1 hypothetical protein [Planctomycetota bacterium]
MRFSRSHLSRLAALLLLTPTATAAVQGSVQVFIGDLAQAGSIAAFDEATGLALGTPAELQSLTLLPLDFNGRRGTDSLRSDRPQMYQCSPTSSHIQLPHGRGRLYRFKRAEANGSSTFGYLVITPSGTIQRLVERPGSGPAGTTDPYTDRVAISPEPRSMLLCTTPAAGGDLLEVYFRTGAVVNRTPHILPLMFHEQSLRMGGDWLTATCTRGVLRSGRGALDRASRVPGIPAGPYFTGELMMSPSGTFAMTTVGSPPGALDVYAYDSTGVANKVNATPAAILGAGFQPEANHGPFFAISDDGVWCAWTTNMLNKRELFMRQNTSAVAPPETQVTSDSNFIDTLEEIGVLGIFEPGKLIAVVGEAGPTFEDSIEGVDFFEVQVGHAGSAVIRNLTQTSGQSMGPITSQPQITPSLMAWVPDAGAFLVYNEQGGNDGSLIAVYPGVMGAQIIATDLRGVYFYEQVGDQLVISLRTALGGNPGHQLLIINSDLTGPTKILLATDGEQMLQPYAVGARWIVFVESPDQGIQSISRVNITNGAYETFGIGADSFGLVMGLTPSGQLAFGLERSGFTTMAIWPMGTPLATILQMPPSKATLIPGK